MTAKLKQSSSGKNTKLKAQKQVCTTNYLLAVEDHYKKLSDAEFIQEFEDLHNQDTAPDYTLLKPRLLPFFEANLDEAEYWQLYDEVESGAADLESYLDQSPALIGLLPLHELWCLDSWERLNLLLHHPQEASVLIQTLEGSDIWATTLPMLLPSLQKKATKLCPWKTMTGSQLRYMKLKSKILKEFIESNKIG